MKIIRTFTGKEFIVENDEAENIKNLKKDDKEGFVDLRNGDFLNLDRIESISNPDKIAYIGTCMGFMLISKDGKSFVNSEGVRVYLKPGDFQDIKFIEHPIYEQELKQINEEIKQLTQKNGSAT